MWTPLSASRWVLLLTLGVVMLLSESEANEHACCYVKGPPNEQEIKDIEKCLKQTSSSKCSHNAYMIKPKHDDWKCINPKTKWLKKLIEEGEIECRDRFKTAPRLEVLDEDEEEEEEEEEEE
ncbi:hypothetical protein INR49_012156 [Caranx melampygus]|nr:hypothetical protein INR49_012156 [Caranx melampygus]